MLDSNAVQFLSPCIGPSEQSPNSIVARMDRSIQAGRESWKEKIRPSLSCTDPNMSSSFSGPDLVEASKILTGLTTNNPTCYGRACWPEKFTALLTDLKFNSRWSTGALISTDDLWDACHINQSTALAPTAGELYANPTIRILLSFCWEGQLLICT